MKRVLSVISILVAASVMLSACGPAPTPVVVEKEKVVEKPVVQTVVVEKEKVVEKPVVQTVVVEKEKVVTKEVLVTPTPAPKPAKPLIYLSNTDPLTLDPHVNYYGYSAVAQLGTYEPLMQFSKPDANCQFDLEPVLATKWEMSADQTVWTFKLREGVKFTDGTPFNAEAVRWNMERLLTLGEVPSSSLKPVVEEVKVVDDLTVQVKLKKPWIPFLRDMSYVRFISPTAAKEHEKEGDWGKGWLYEHAVGTGPYLLKEWVHGDHVTVVKNPDYWGGWEGKHIEEVIIRIVPDPTTRKVMLIQGDAHVIAEPSTEHLADLEAAKGVVVKPNCAGRSILTFVMKNRGALADPKVRKALALAFDYQGFAEGVMKGRYQPASGPLTPGAELGASADRPAFHKDIAKAKQLMAEAGYPNGLDKPLEAWIVSGYLWFEKDVAEIWQAGLAELGVQLKIVDHPKVSTFFAGAHSANVEEGPDIFGWSIETWTGDPDLNLRMYHSQFAPPAGMNGGHHNIPGYDALVDAIAAEADSAKRLEMIRQAEQMLIDAQPALFVCFINRWFAYRAELSDWYSVYGQVGRWYEFFFKE